MRELFRFDVTCDESKIQKTISVSKEEFLSEESEQTVSHIEFLYQQSKFIKKRCCLPLYFSCLKTQKPTSPCAVFWGLPDRCL